MAAAFLVAALVAAVARALSHRRTKAKALIALKAEGAALLNLDPLGMLKRGDAKDAAHALAVFRIPVARWVEEALPALRRAGATDGEVSDFTTIIIRRRTRP